jgi:tetratricopeptide (TPR) repeat protein
VFLLGAIPEQASKLIALGYADPAKGNMVLCCVPSDGGILHIDTAAFAEPSQSGQQARPEQKFLAFLPIPAALLAQPSDMQFGAMQEDRTQTIFNLQVKRMPAMDESMRQSVMREYRHLFVPAVTALLPANSPMRKAMGAAAAHAPAAKLATENPAAKPTPATPAAKPVSGFLDEFIDGRAEGWAYDPTNPKQKLVVEIMEGERVVARGIADRFRDDLLNAGIGDGRHSYKLPISFELRDGKPHKLTARVAGSKRLLQVKGGGGSSIFEHAAVDTSDFDLIPSSAALQMAQALAASLKVPEQQREFAQAFANANMALETRELIDATRGFLDLLPKFGEQPLFFCKVAETYTLTGRHQDAVRTYQKAIECGPNFGWAWLGLGGAQRLLAAWPEAEVAYRKGAELMPKSAQAKKRLADVTALSLKAKVKSLSNQGKPEQAVAILKEHLLKNLDDEDSWNLLQQTLCAAPKQGEAAPLDDKELQAFEAARQMLDIVLDAAEAALKAAK